MQPGFHIAGYAALTSEMARLERRVTARPRAAAIGFGHICIKEALPGGSVATGAICYVAGIGPQA